MGFFSLRSVPEVAKAWLDAGDGSWRERLRFASSWRTPSSASGEDESLTGGERVRTFDQPGARILSGDRAATLLGSGAKVWRQKLTLASSQLKDISASTEGEFLTIGERLQDFYKRASEITAVISGLVSQLGGEKGAAAISALAGLLEALRGHLDEAQNQRERQSFSEILVRLQKVNAPLTGFAQMDKSLRMFSTYTKIESARLGSRAVGFESLAKDVIRLSGAVSAKAGTVQQQKDELTAVIGNALATVVSMGTEQHAKIESVLAKTNQSLDAFADIVDRAFSSAGLISASAVEVTENLGQVVMSLQAHDTVRQQIQHVTEVLDELKGRLPGPGSSLHLGAGLSSHLVVETGTLCGIQSAQLRHSSAELLEAVENIIVNLRQIAVKETGMSNDTQGLLGMTDQTGGSFFTEMGEDLVEVLGMLTVTAMNNRKLSEVMTRAAETVGGIFRFVDDIETIAYDIKLIALNFLIQAAQLGSEGGGLGVMAEAINRLSEEARDQAAGISVTLAEIKEVTDRMCQGAMMDASSMESGIKEMRQGLEEMLATLQEMNAGTAQGLTRANVMVQELSADIDEVTAGITVHRKVAAVLDEAEAILDGIGTEAKAMSPEAEWLTAMEKLQAADKRYTMHSERDIHAAVVNAHVPLAVAAQEALVAVLSPEAGPEKAGEGDLGDNVELF